MRTCTDLPWKRGVAEFDCCSSSRVMAKLSHGPASHAVKTSRGPSPAPLHFYTTNYSRHHGNRNPAAEELGGVVGRARGTGYIANFRPTLYYSSYLDQVDNPHMVSLLADNYASRSSRHYSGFKGPSGSEPFPRSTITGQSGYSCNLPRTTPTTRQVTDAYSGGRRHSPLLHSLHPRDPISTENSGLGPGMTCTETKTKFTHKPFRDEALRGSLHTRSEDTGFTHAQNIEPVTFRPPETFVSDLPPETTRRPTARSVMKRTFTAPAQLTGTEGVPLLSERADRSNGYVKGSNFSSSVQPKSNEKVGYTVTSQLHPSPLATTHRERGRGGGEGAVGRKELTGFSENNQPLVEPRDKDSSRFSTHYHAQFPRPPLHRTGSEARAVQAAALNGFSRGTQIHKFQGGLANTADTLRSMHPSQAKLVLRQDPCYDDHTHDAKLHTLT